uniref:DUF4708 domain-containing protein n=1 Tax=Strigamia maritima TaxID=126957 RepID=T1ISB7_STRMM
MQYFSANLDLEDLYLLMVAVEKEKNVGECRRKRNAKCRELIAIEPNIIASPHDIHDNTMQLILQKSFYKSGNLQQNLMKLELKEEKLMAVTNRDYQVCFHYTLVVKLAPRWNEIGSQSYENGILLVQGANFLTSKKPLPALTLEVNVMTSEVQISLQPFMIKIPVTKFTNFGITAKVAKEFSSKEINIIPDKHIKRQWCSIFPSMKMGKVVEISREISSYSNFKDYAEMRVFWKNNYGYQLPSRNDFYYGVYFSQFGRTLTYPRCCILPEKPNVWKCTESNATHMSDFMKDVNMKLAVLCGQGLNFVSRASRLPMQLIPATQVSGEDDDNSFSHSST